MDILGDFDSEATEDDVLANTATAVSFVDGTPTATATTRGVAVPSPRGILGHDGSESTQNAVASTTSSVGVIGDPVSGSNNVMHLLDEIVEEATRDEEAAASTSIVASATVSPNIASIATRVHAPQGPGTISSGPSHPPAFTQQTTPTTSTTAGSTLQVATPVSTPSSNVAQLNGTASPQRSTPGGVGGGGGGVPTTSTVPSAAL